MEASIINPEDILSFEEIEYETTYDISVEGNSNFYLATSGSPILVHNSGKSEFIDYIMCCLAKIHQWSWAICSFENQPSYLHVTKLMEKITNKSFAFRENRTFRMTPEERDYGIFIVDQYFHFINIAEIDVSVAGIIQKATELVVRKGVKGLLIDPWNYIEHKIPAGYTETQYISECLTSLKYFALKYGVHVFLIAHPTKIQKNKETGNYDIPTLYQISGSAHFFNKTDIGLTVYRDFKTNVVDIYIQKMRSSWLGRVGFCTFSYDTMTRQYVSDSAPFAPLGGSPSPVTGGWQPHLID